MFSPVSKNRLKTLAKLKMKKYRDRNGLYIISGERAVTGALSAPDPDVISVLATADQQDTMTRLTGAYSALKKAEHLLLTPAEFASISDEQHPQGLALVARKPHTRLSAEQSLPDRLIYLDRISDPGNLGTIIRTALWFGMDSLLLSPASADPFQGKSVRSSAGYITQATLFEECNVADIGGLKQGSGYSLVAATPEKSLSLPLFRPEGKFILMFGSEASGLDRQLREICDRSVCIPGTNRVESLNLAASVACFLYHVHMSTTEVSQ